MKQILITGATSGIGKATAELAAAQSWHVIACGRNESKLQELEDANPNITGLKFDITDLDATKAALGSLSPDVVLLNAGVCEYVDAEDWDSALFRRVFEANFFGLTHCIEALLPQMKAGSRIAVVDSLARLLPFTRSQAYGASKAAAFYMAKSLEVDLAPRGIAVQTISPGFVETPLTDKNEFSMPMRITSDEAAKAILRAVSSDKRTHYFPGLFAAILRALSSLPASVQSKLCQRMAASQS